MKHLIIVLSLGLSIALLPLKAFAAGHYQIDSTVSTVSFATIKKQYILEPAVITGLSGSLDESGNLLVAIPISNIDTGVPIRNERLGELFFNVADFPQVMVQATVPAELLSGDSLVTQATVPASVTMYGKDQDIDFSLNIVRFGDVMSVSSTKPVIIDGASFGIPTESLAALSNTVGDIAISTSVAASVSLVLRK
ncbi:YceI family protein [Vibrio sp. WXL103]|uniref:YceI family protein n=1 Tax=Vibrio sp. WXL103 TaxID=3450710 RepID=UPI003EC4B4EA